MHDEKASCVGLKLNPETGNFVPLVSPCTVLRASICVVGSLSAPDKISPRTISAPPLEYHDKLRQFFWLGLGQGLNFTKLENEPTASPSLFISNASRLSQISSDSRDFLQNSSFLHPSGFVKAGQLAGDFIRNLDGSINARRWMLEEENDDNGFTEGSADSPLLRFQRKGGESKFNPQLIPVDLSSAGSGLSSDSKQPQFADFTVDKLVKVVSLQLGGDKFSIFREPEYKFGRNEKEERKQIALRRLLRPSSNYEISAKFRSLLAEAEDLCELLNFLRQIKSNKISTLAGFLELGNVVGGGSKHFVSDSAVFDLLYTRAQFTAPDALQNFFSFALAQPQHSTWK
ncbi:Oidioi.mRNA.OKI2018_I69.chr1.g2109.t1.cds [Oikopleura dioica]|uniref:Oidioi.mRNA.OKI2018_I69.chr1.g2109.t1.cds n=1 Tax=Oikopleura dioica TaxID=34765 RepID=A0ABN7SRS1_OIKDI|nr:Oidioi.mRNA.OKI2018_I69.chr1.g2109.t1.cds [Oikopleura dioica]